MKNKQVGLVGMAFAAMALLAIAAQVFWVSWNQVRPLALGTALDGYSYERLLVDTGAVERMDLVEPTLPNLVKPEVAIGTGVIGGDSEFKYAMLGQRPAKVAVVETAETPEPVEPEEQIYQVAMTYISGNHRYAVVDRKFYRLGALLPYGENLAEISDDAVRIESEEGSRWIPIYRADNYQTTTEASIQ